MKQKQNRSIWHLAGRPSLVCFALLTPLSAAASVGFALSLQPILDTALNWSPARFATSCVWTLLLALTDLGLDYGLRRQRIAMVNRCTRQLSQSTFHLMLRQNVERFTAQDSSLYLSQLTSQVPLISSRYLDSALKLYGCLWSLVASFAALAGAGWGLALYVAVCSLAAIYLPKCLQKKSAQAERTYLQATADHIAQAQEGLSNFLLLRLHQLFPAQEALYGQCAAQVERQDNRRQHLLVAMDSLSSAISQFSYLLILAGCVILVVQGRLSVGYTMSITQLVGGIMVPFEAIPSLWLALRTGKSLYQSHLAQLKKGLDVPGTRALPHPPQHISLDQVSFSYANCRPVLSHMTLRLDCTKKYALVGESGCGKSTLAKLVMGFLTPTQGTVHVDDVPLAQISQADYYRWVGYQSQSFSCLRGTIEDNILLGHSLSLADWNHLMETVQLNRWLSTLPHGPLTSVEENGKNLSGGQAQRMALARCLAEHPSFLVLDEITAALDVATAAALENTILSLDGVGLLLITHRLSSQRLQRFDSILFMEDGAIVEQGSWTELMAQQGKFYHLVTKNQ